jgi:regulator of sirC expression with transglutaminase-like and TPR domain
MRKNLIDALTTAASGSGTSLAQAALLVARVEYPELDPVPYLSRLDALGEGARARIERDIEASGNDSLPRRLASLNAFLFDEQGFTGTDTYEDPRDSCLNQVLDRRTGIPITLSLVYMEVAARAGLHVDGINFPGHFLVRCPDGRAQKAGGIILDPFHAGAVLSERECRLMLRKHVGADVAFDRELLAPATRSQIVVRMLLNLKRVYEHMRSFPQARDVSDVLLSITPSALTVLRDRGLLAYNLNDFTGALRDLQTYLKLSGMTETESEDRKDRERLWDHVNTLRRRVASFN